VHPFARNFNPFNVDDEVRAKEYERHAHVTAAICGRRELTNHWNKSHHRRSVSSHCSTTPAESARGDTINEDNLNA
jgi:hypothetical protein